MGLDVFQLERGSRKDFRGADRLVFLRIPQSQVETGSEREVGQEAGRTAKVVEERWQGPS